jgi:SAM-dependent methyltransferase
MEEWRKFVTPRERDNNWNALLSGGAKIRLLESFIDFELAALLAAEGPLSAEAIAKKLALHPHRARKWFHLLSLVGLVQEIVPPDKLPGHGDEVYAITPMAQSLFGDDGKSGAFYRDRMRFWRNISGLDFNAVLRGLPLPLAVEWPPQTFEAATHLEWWMRITAPGAIQAIEKAVDLNTVTKMFDAGGGDGTMACAFAQSHQNLDITVFNLPNSAYLARNKVAQEKLSDKITIAEGDFLSEEPFPGGFELVLWSRVFTDWAADVVQRLIRKTYEALIPGGRIAICEPLLESNKDLITEWEFRYIFYDDFGVAVFKTRAVYERLLTGAGFELTSFSDRDDESCYSAIIATRPQ